MLRLFFSTKNDRSQLKKDKGELDRKVGVKLMNFETSNAKGVQMHTEVLRNGLLKSFFHIMPQVVAQQRPQHIKHAAQMRNNS